MNKLGSKMPVLRGLEKKLDLMNELKPELRSLANDISSIADPTDVVQARQGREEVRRMLNDQSR